MDARLPAAGDQRRGNRVEFFWVPADHEPLPVWVFKPRTLQHERAGLVLNLGEGGLQVLTSGPLDEPHDRYQLSLLLGEDEGVPLFHGPVQRLWTRELGRGHLSGLAFAAPNSLAEQFLLAQSAHVSTRPWVGCVLTAHAALSA